MPTQTVVKSLSGVWFSDPMDGGMLAFPVLHYVPEFAQIHVHESVMLSNYLILCHHLILLTSMFPSIGVISNELSTQTSWTKSLG